MACGSLFCGPALARARSGAYRVAFWGSYRELYREPRAPLVEETLARHGFVPGGNTTMHYAFAERADEAFARQAREIVSHNPHVIVVEGTAVDRKVPALLALTKAIPIVFFNVMDSPASGGVGDYRHRAGEPNVTGVIAPDLTEKRIELACDLVPAAKTVALVWASKLGDRQAPFLRALDAAAERRSVRLAHVEVADMSSTLERVRASNAQAFTLNGFKGTPQLCEALAAFEESRRTPYIGFSSGTTVRKCGVLNLGPDAHSAFRRAMEIVARILKGAKVADIPLDRSMLYVMTVNLRIASAIGLEVPKSILLRADVVVH